MSLSPDNARAWFGYKEGTPDELQACIRTRTGFADLAALVARELPDGPDRAYALRKLKDACQAAIGGIVAPIPH